MSKLRNPKRKSHFEIGGVSESGSVASFTGKTPVKYSRNFFIILDFCEHIQA